MRHLARALVITAAAVFGISTAASAQGFSAPVIKPKPWSRVSVFTNSSDTKVDNGTSSTFTEVTTAFAYQLPDTDDNGADYGLDLRYTDSSIAMRPNRLSIYEAFIGARLGDGRARVRVGHLWLTDLGSLGSIAGGVFEVKQPRLLPEDGRWRVGAFGGLEPSILDTGYAPNVQKFGSYVAYDGANARRHSVGYIMVRNGSMTERSVVAASNFLPIRRKFYLYQAGEYNVQPPAGQGDRGLAYLFSNARVNPVSRLELQATYNRGRSVDARGIIANLTEGRPLTQASIDGLLYSSVGGRVTVEVVPRVHIYGGYSQDKNNRDAEPTGRTLVGGYASNVFKSGFDVSGSDNLMKRSTGDYHSRYVSLGHQIGRRIYTTVDYTTSLSVVRFSRSDGITIESRPHTARYSGTATINVTRTVSILATLDRTDQDDVHELRVLSGLTYRIR
jgi:hypothetical protein